MRRPLVAGNWKMNGNLAANQALLEELAAGLQDVAAVDCLVFPPFVYLSQLADVLKGSSLGWGAQNMAEHLAGAYTGEVSCQMLLDFACSHVLLGHSERRHIYNEGDEQIAEKCALAVENNLIPIICLGETLAEREAGETEAVVTRQLDAVLNRDNGLAIVSQSILAYEPVWAIGTGKTATPEQAQEIHAILRAHVAKKDASLAADIRILYGGSVNPGNAAELFAMPDIDGGLIGGASLKADQFLQICHAAEQ